MKYVPLERKYLLRETVVNLYFNVGHDRNLIVISHHNSTKCVLNLKTEPFNAKVFSACFADGEMTLQESKTVTLMSTK